MTTFFSQEQMQHGYPKDIENNFWHRCRNRIIEETLRAYAPHTSVLDLGCGTGTTTNYLRNKNVHIVGVEPGNPPITAQQRAYIYTKTLAHELNNGIKNNIQTILLLDVIEHIQEPDVFIQELMREFPNTTRLIITVPARKELWSLFDEIYGHFRRYDKPLLKKTLHDAGLRVQTMRYFFHALIIPIFLKRCVLKHKPESTAPAHHRLLHAIIGWLCYMEYRFFPGWLPGSSLLCVAEKSDL